MPTAFFVTTNKPNQTDEAGRIEESYYVVQDGKVFLSDASGVPNGEGHTIVRDELFTARRALRQRLAARRAPGRTMTRSDIQIRDGDEPPPQKAHGRLRPS